MIRNIILCLVFSLLLTGCATTKEPVSVRQPKKLITRDDYDDLKVKPCEEKPTEVDYRNEGVYKPSIETMRK